MCKKKCIFAPIFVQFANKNNKINKLLTKIYGIYEEIFWIGSCSAGSVRLRIL